MNTSTETWTPAQPSETCGLCGGELATDESHFHSQCADQENARSDANDLGIVAKAPRYSDVSTVEGRLEAISVHDRPALSIWDMLTNDKIECLVNDAQLATGLTLLRKRVAVTGVVKYVNHVPKSVQVDSFDVLPEMESLPQPQNIRPINITNGLSSEEHVRRIRDA